VQVTLTINATPTAHILLSGAGAAGERDYTILPPYVPLARQYGAVRLWMGYPWTGFYSDRYCGDTQTVVIKTRCPSRRCARSPPIREGVEALFLSIGVRSGL
jgi:hypothetical protein